MVYLDKELCRRSWYFDHIEANHPHFFYTSQPEIERFLEEVYRFENQLRFDPYVIEEAYINMLNSFFVKNFGQKPIYDDLFTDTKIGEMFAKIPEGLVFAAKDSVGYYAFDFPDLQLRGITDERVYKDDRTINVLRQYPLMIDTRIKYLAYFNQETEASKLREKYLEYLTQPIR